MSAFSGNFTIRIEVLENGYKVEVPDMEELKKKEAERKKRGDKYPSYIGDCTKSYAARTQGEVVKLVKGALTMLPDGEYDDAYEQATAKADK